MAARAWGNLLLLDPVPAASTAAAGGSLWRLPRFPGSGRTQDLFVPALDWYGASGLFASTDTGLGWNLSARKDTQAGLRLWPQMGRRSRDVAAGVGGIATRWQVEAYANHAPFEALLLQSGLLHGAGVHRDGTQLEIGATSGVPIGGDLLGIGVAATYANRAYRQDYFGISPAQAMASGLPAQTLSAGWHDSSLTFSGEHRLDAHWRLDGQLVRALLTRSTATAALRTARRQQAATLSLWCDF